MSRPVNAVPPLPYPGRGLSLPELAAFDQDLIRALHAYLGDLARRANDCLPKDGQEHVTGPIIFDDTYLQIQRVIAPGQFFRVGPSDAVGHNIKGFSDVTNGKGFVFNVTTVAADTAPSAGENSYSFQIRSVEKLRIDDSTNSVDVKSGVLLDVQSGQIKFPATQAASSNANTLDDYEEGTWTPVLTFGGASTGITYTTQTGAYVKVGRLVFARCRIVLSNKGSATGTAAVTGVPFSVNDDSGGSVAYATAMAALTSDVSIYVDTANKIFFLDYGATGRAFMDDTNFTNTSDFALTIMYEATA